MILVTFLVTSCGPSVSITSWTNPKEKEKIGNVVIWGMFEKLEYQKPFEQCAVNYLNSKGFKAMESLKFLVPGTKYDLKNLENKFDSLGVDSILVVTILFNFSEHGLLDMAAYDEHFRDVQSKEAAMNLSGSQMANRETPDVKIIFGTHPVRVP